VAAWTSGAWVETYSLGLFFHLRPFLSLGVPCSPGSRQLCLVLENRTCFTVVFSYCILQLLTSNALFQETRDLRTPVLAIFLLRFSLTAIPLGGAFLGSVLDFGRGISGPEPPVGVLLPVLGQGSSSLGLPNFSLIVWKGFPVEAYG
jgi:hypothetical protein